MEKVLEKNKKRKAMLSLLMRENDFHIINNERMHRDQKQDLKIAIDYLYEFKEKLILLHPSVNHIIELMLKSEV